MQSAVACRAAAPAVAQRRTNAVAARSTVVARAPMRRRASVAVRAEGEGDAAPQAAGIETTGPNFTALKVPRLSVTAWPGSACCPARAAHRRRQSARRLRPWPELRLPVLPLPLPRRTSRRS